MTRKIRIEQSILKHLSPQLMQVIDESSQHAVAPGSETHFKLIVISEKFTGLKPLARHQQLYSLLKTELDSGLHALSMTLKTPEEWEAEGNNVPSSPICKGGFRHG